MTDLPQTETNTARSPEDAEIIVVPDGSTEFTIDARIIDAFNSAHDFSLRDSLIMLCRVGSLAHGTHVPSSEPGGIDDVDLMGVVIPPSEYLFGLKVFEGWNYQFEELDVVLYSYPKMLKLLLKNNPNVLGTLWQEETDYVYLTETWEDVIRYRNNFLSTALFKSFRGYAESQRYKMEHTQFQGYMGEKRKKLVEKFGYDTKNAAHLIRLLRMCNEALKYHCLFVFRHDADELKDIKSGLWTREEVLLEADRLIKSIEERQRDYPSMPESPETKIIFDLAVSHLRKYV